MRLRTWGIRTWFNAHDEPLDNIDSAKLFLLEFFLVLLLARLFRDFLLLQLNEFFFGFMGLKGLLLFCFSRVRSCSNVTFISATRCLSSASRSLSRAISCLSVSSSLRSTVCCLAFAKRRSSSS